MIMVWPVKSAHCCLSLAWFNTLPATQISVTGSLPAARLSRPLLLPAGTLHTRALAPADSRIRQSIQWPPQAVVPLC